MNRKIYKLIEKYIKEKNININRKIYKLIEKYINE